MSRVLGVNLNTRGAGFSVVERRLGAARALKNEDVALPEQGEERTQALADALGRFKKDHGVTGVVVGLPLRHFLPKVLDMPPLSRNELKGALSFELEKHLPLDIDEYQFDFMGQEQAREASKVTRTTVLAVRKDTIEALIKPFQSAGIEVLAVSCAPLNALGRVLEIEKNAGFSGMVLHGNDDAYELMLVEKGQPVLMRRVPRDADVLQAIEQMSEGRPGLVCCAGEVDPHVTERIGCKKVFFRLPEVLAASGTRRLPTSLNFLPAEMLKPRRDLYPFAMGGLAAASLLLFLASGVATYFQHARDLKKLRVSVQEAKARSAGLVESRKKADRLFSEVSALRDYSLSSNSAIRLLAGLGETVPVHTWVVNFSMDEKGKVEIEGISRKTSEVIVALEKDARVKNVSFSAPITYKDGEERFSLRMEMAE